MISLNIVFCSPHVHPLFESIILMHPDARYHASDTVSGRARVYVHNSSHPRRFPALTTSLTPPPPPPSPVDVRARRDGRGGQSGGAK